MAVSGLNGGARTLVVLVLVSVVMSRSERCRSWHEFDRCFNKINEMFKSCLSDCNATQITDSKCHCLNLNTSECGFFTYFMSGLEAVKHTLPEKLDCLQTHMINKVNFTEKYCKKYTVDIRLSCNSSVSPQSFLKTMAEVKQNISSSQVEKHK